MGNSSVDELQDVDEVVIDYIKNTNCFDLEQDPDSVFYPDLLQSTNDDVEFLFERHSAYLAMKEKFPESVDEIFRPADSANVGVDVDVINPENSNVLKLRIYSSSEDVINDTWTRCLVEGYGIIHQKSNPPLEYILDTDCLEKKLDPDYAYHMNIEW